MQSKMQDSNLVVLSDKQEYSQPDSVKRSCSEAYTLLDAFSPSAATASQTLRATLGALERASALLQSADRLLIRSLVWLLAAILACASLFSSPAPVWAKPFKSDRTEVQLIGEVKTIQPGTPFWVGLQFKTRPGWHTYWRNPGDSGSPTRVDWTLPSRFKAGELVYPYPERFPIGPLMNFGYKGENLLLTEITPPANLPTARPVTLKAAASWLVCEVECIPEDATFTLTLPVTSDAPTVDSTVADAFAKTRQAVPQPSPWNVTFQQEQNDLVLRVDAPKLQAGRIEQASFFPDRDGVIANAAAQSVGFDDKGLTLRVARGQQAMPDKVEGVLVLREKLEGQTTTQAIAIAAQPAKASAATSPASAPATAQSLWQTLLLALVGGIVLNLMPCVFPVLSLKALGIAHKAQQSAQQARLHGIAFTAGVLASFAALVSVLLVLRGLGQQIGWGFQLQSPAFVLVMVYVLFAVGLNLSGVFVVGASIMGLGQGLASKSGYVGEFFTGVLATVMATPCTAPFMATAVSVALTQPAPLAIAIFLTLGLGLALPYLIISFTPALRRYLPKPGAWMETFQQLLAFPIYAAVAWLLWVLTLQAGTDGLAVALAGLIAIAFAAWLYQKTQTSRQFWRRVCLVGSLSTLVLALTLTPLVGTSPKPSSQATNPSTNSGLAWQPYTSEQLETLRQSGQPVFVNFTAAWCVTCLMNERVALSQPEVIAAFKQTGVALVKADWTNRDTTITEALSKFGRSGVPLYVLYPRGLDRGEPVVLPQVLAPAIVQDALKQVSS
jgi:thiol:disulfide interchange protein